MMSATDHAIAVLGEVLADVFPTQVMIGGAPFNVACHLRAFGLYPLLMTRIGKDSDGAMVEQSMQHHDLNMHGVQHDDVLPTGQVQVHLSEHGHQFEILANQAYDQLDFSAIGDLNKQHAFAMAYIGSLALRTQQNQQSAQVFLRSLKCPIFCDINLRAPWYDLESIGLVLSNADSAKINHEELAEIASLLGISGDAEQQARAIQLKFQLKNVFITCGEHGSWCLDTKQQLWQVEPVKLQTAFVDSVGAGDAYSAVCIIGLLKGWSISKILSRANVFATALCGVRGAVPKDANFYLPHLQAWELVDAS